MVTKENSIKHNAPVRLRKSDQCDITGKITVIQKNTNATQGWVNKKMRDELLKLGSDKETINLIVTYIEKEYNSNNEKNKKLSEIISFAQPIWENTAKNYFKIMDRTKAVKELTNSEVLKFASSIGSFAAYSYFDAIATTKAVELLTSPEFLNFIKSLGEDGAFSYFRVMANTKVVELLTSPEFLRFASSLGSFAAPSYFNAISCTKADKDIL